MKRKRDVKEPGDAQLQDGSIEGEDVAPPTVNDQTVAEQQQQQQETPTKRRPGRPPGSKNRVRTADVQVTNSPAPITPSKPRQTDIQLTTPSKSVRFADDQGGTAPVRNADRSARRKSAQTLIKRTTSGALSDEDALEEGEDELAQDIWGDRNGDAEEEEDEEDEDQLPAEEDQEEEEDGPEGGLSATSTPSKRARGRPRGSRNKPSPPPPPNLPAHEQYFFHNRPSGNKTSNNTLASLSLLSHEEYFDIIRDYIDPHEQERAVLHELHARAFRQWRFESSEGFSICLYGWGSKRNLIMTYAEWLYDMNTASGGGGGEGGETNSRAVDDESEPNIVVVNGYVSSVSIKEIINMIATAAFGANHPYKISGQPGQMMESLLSLLDEHHHHPQLIHHPITLIIHSIDSLQLRGSSTQSLLSRLAAHKNIHLICSADHPSFPLLWDTALRETFNFVFHDTTTFDPYEVEVDVVDSVNELLGRSGRRVGGKEGVGYVLKSLPENARNLYRVLVSEQLAGMEGGIEGGDDGDDNDEDEERQGPGRTSVGDTGGIEYRVLYQKAVEEFICSNEIAFRTLLKE